MTKKEIKNLNYGFISMIFRHFRHLFVFSSRQGGRSALAIDSKIKNLLEIALNLIVNKPITQVRRAFTLLEIMIALMMISIIGALTAVQAKKLIDVHRFESKIADLFITLQEAQLLSTVYQTDFVLDIDVGKEGITYRFSTDEPFPSYKFKKGVVKLPPTTVVKFKDAKTTKLHFDIYSGGRIEPEGILAFYPNQESEKAFWFDLQHGFLLKFSHNKPAVAKRHVPSPPKQA